MADTGGFKPETARLILDVVKYLRESGFVIQPPGRGGPLWQPEAPIFFRNDSGETVPAFACMQTTGTVESGGQNYITIDKPADTTGAAGWYLFNGIAEVAVDGYGVAYAGPLVRMLTDGSAVASGDKWQPVVSAWTVEPGGSQFIAVGGDDIAANVMRGFSSASGVGTGGGQIVHFKSQGSGIPAISTLTMGSATCDLYDCDGSGVLSDSGSDITVYNMAGAFAANTLGVAALNSAGLYVAIVEKC